MNQFAGHNETSRNEFPNEGLQLVASKEILQILA